MAKKHPGAVSLGKLGGAIRSAAKGEASRRNGAKGGRPRVRVLCGLAHGDAVPGVGLVYCTRVRGHQGDHAASIGPWRAGVPVLARWGQS